ncbi:MAG TPA: hypothetical protein VND92_00370 [Vicinamibacterales bacterium]|nr:hypothetical protein [Vicinamibacterales bacterium]
MNVFLIPVGADEYALYSEVPAGEVSRGDDELPSGVIGRLVRRAQQLIASLEREPEPAPGEPSDWRDRLRRGAARRIGEQRLLWRLRGEHAATVVCPDDCPEALAVDILRAELKRDGDRHRLWFVVDTVAFVASGLLMLLPGPNVIAYYLAFSLVGHYLSLRGATQGRQRVRWDARQDPALSALRRAIALPDAERDRQVHEIAGRLHLPNLPGFFARVPRRSA